MATETAERRTGGRRTRDLSRFVTSVCTAPEGNCPDCGCLLTIQQHRRRPLQTLEARQILVMKDRRCCNPECPGARALYRPLDPNRLLLRDCEFGLDVIAFVGESRQHRNMSFPTIHTELAEKHGVIISERHVPNLFRLYLALVDCRTARDEVVQARLGQQGTLILSGDAVRFDDVSPAVYVVREVVSGEILVAARLKQASEEALAEMLAPIRDMGVPVVGTICDKEKALLGAFETAFPEARHQICQTHYLLNLVKPMAADLATLGAAVKDTVRKVSEVAKTLDRARVAGPEERDLAEMVCQAVAAIGKSHAGDKLFEPPALKRHARLTELANETGRAVKQKGGTWPLLERLLALFRAMLLGHDQPGPVHALRP